MATLKQFDPLVINSYVTDVFLYPPHSHTYYELIYIFKGSGSHSLNHIQFTYTSGDLFLIAPDDSHHFQVEQPTHFVVIKFTEHYFNENPHQFNGMDAEPLPLRMMKMKFIKESKLEFYLSDCLSLKNTIKTIIGYKDRQYPERSAYLYFQILSVFGLISDTLRTKTETAYPAKADKQAVLSYVHQHIYDTDKCRIKNIANYFNISVSYFGLYFKRNFSFSYREYLHQYRISLIKNRIENGQLNMKQIATEFGFNDESHFSNYFKKQTQIRPGAYKRSIEN